MGASSKNVRQSSHQFLRPLVGGDWSDQIALEVVCPECGESGRALRLDASAASPSGDAAFIAIACMCGASFRLEACFGNRTLLLGTNFTPRQSDFSLVYFIEAHGRGLIKIGKADNPVKRLEQLRESTGWDLRLLGTIHGGFETERVLHQMFAEHRKTGEWFDDCGALRDFIRRAGE